MLRSISLRYDANEDRLIMRLVSDPSGDEQVLQLTRRVSGLWRTHLQQLVNHSADVPATLSEAAREAVSTAHHQAMVAQATIRHQPAAEAEPQADPQLVVAIRCGRRRDDGRWVFRFATTSGREVTLQVSSESLHGLVRIVNAQTSAADWQLPALPFDRPESSESQGLPLH